MKMADQTVEKLLVLLYFSMILMKEQTLNFYISRIRWVVCKFVECQLCEYLDFHDQNPGSGVSWFFRALINLLVKT